MGIVEATQINSFGPSPGADVSPSETITVSLADLRQIIQDAIEPLKDRIESLESIVASQQAEMASMKADIKLDGHDIRDIYQHLDALASSGRFAPAPTTAPPRGEKTIARIAKIDEVLKSRGPTTLSQLGRILGIDRATMTRLLGKLDMRRYELHARPGDARERVLRLRAQIR